MYRHEKHCVFCANLLQLDSRSALHRATIEHMHPLCLGGTWKRGNLRLSCESCNNAKGDLPEADFRALVTLHGPRNVKPYCKVLSEQRRSRSSRLDRTRIQPGQAGTSKPK